MEPEWANSNSPFQRRYPPELRERAVRMVREAIAESGERVGAVTRVARQLGIGPESLRNWVKQADINHGKRPGVTTEQQRRIAELEHENRELRRANEIPKAASAFFREGARPSTDEVVSFINAYKERWGIEPTCNELRVAPSTYYAATAHLPSARQRRDEQLKVEIGRVHRDNFGVYAIEKVWRQLNREGIQVGRDHVHRLMDELDLEGVVRGKRKPATTMTTEVDTRPDDLVQRNFTAAAPNALWVADLTYVNTWSGTY